MSHYSVAICKLDQETKIVAYKALKVDLSRRKMTCKGKQIKLIFRSELVLL